MMTTSIQSLKPNVSREEALQSFTAAKLSGMYWQVTKGPLRRLADAYVPFSVFTVRYLVLKATVKRVFALDAVNGSLDLFEFTGAPEAQQLVALETRNAVPTFLSESRAKELLADKVLRLIFQQGFFRLREPKLEILSTGKLIYVPYWLGFYGDSSAHCRALDAVRRRFEGAKASAFFEEWLAAA